MDITRQLGLPDQAAAQVFVLISSAGFASGSVTGALVDRLAVPHRMIAVANALVTGAFLLLCSAPSLYGCLLYTSPSPRDRG